MDCWVRRFTTTNTTHHQHFLVKRCTSASKPCMASEHHGLSKRVQHHPPPTFISLLSHARQRKNDGLQWIISNGVNCKQVLAKNQNQMNIKCVQKHHPPIFMSVVCLRKYVSRNLLTQKLYRRQSLREKIEIRQKMYVIEGRF